MATLRRVGSDVRGDAEGSPLLKEHASAASPTYFRGAPRLAAVAHSVSSRGKTIGSCPCNASPASCCSPCAALGSSCLHLVATSVTASVLAAALIMLCVLLSFNSTLSNEASPSLSPLGPGSVFIAANLYNSEHLFPRWSDELLRLTRMLGRDRVFVYVFENGSKDDTKLRLRELDEQLTSLRVKHAIDAVDSAKPANLTWYNLDDPEHDLIVYLSEKRNMMVDALRREVAAGLEVSRVLFLNDIVYDADDAMRILHLRDGDYDAACGMDFYDYFYDRWVTRDVQGGIMGKWYPWVKEPVGQAAVRRGQPFRVTSCWNGLVAMRPEVFTQHGIRFRASKAEEGCYSSECLNVYLDMAQAGMRSVWMDPTVVFAYELRYYLQQRYLIHPFNAWREWWGLAPAEVTTEDYIEPDRIAGMADASHPILCPRVPMSCCGLGIDWEPWATPGYDTLLQPV